MCSLSHVSVFPEGKDLAYNMAIEKATLEKMSDSRENTSESNSAQEDRRVQRTRRALRESLVKLMRKKPLAEITTSELCRAADLNRNTFYAHYKSPLDVFEEIQEEYYDTMSNLMRNLGSDSLFDITCAILRATKRNREFALVITQGASHPGDLSQRLWNVSRERWFDMWDDGTAQIPESVKERVFTFAANGYTASQIAWIRSGMHDDIEEVARAVTDMSIAAIRAGLQVYSPEGSVRQSSNLDTKSTTI